MEKTMIKQKHIYYGGDYNPDQWDDATIAEDMRLFKKAGINLVTLPVFSWAKLEPEEGRYNFEWLDKILDILYENGISVCLATPTTAQPAWLSTRYPEVLPVDIAGRKRTHGMRVFFCVNSSKYRERAAAIAEQMAKRYASHPALKLWHVANEYGTYCYCPTCEAKFRKWLRERYGSIEELNKRWSTAFWGRVVYSFEEVYLPTELNDDYRFNPPIALDYLRFITDSTAECFENEYNVIKKYSPNIPITTNMSGYIKKLDQFVMASKLDVVGWDNYPSPQDDPALVALKHDIMRGLRGGQSFYLMEQSPNQQNWQPYNKLKKPGEVRLLSYQALAHGADTCLFFQMRQSQGGQEKFHGAVITHAGHDNTRVFRETTQLGKELEKLGDRFVGARSHNQVGLLFDWNNWWALELSSGPSKDMNYLQTVTKYYKALQSSCIGVDIVGMETEDYSGYQVLVAPMLYMLKPGLADKLKAFVAGGGILIGTTMSGLADENDRCVFGEYPGPLKDIFGLWVEETDALLPNERNALIWTDETKLDKKEYACGFLCDIIHTRGAKVLAEFQQDFYAGLPAVCENNYGSGKGYFIGTEPEQVFLTEWITKICRENGVQPVIEAENGVEATCRENEQGKTIFVINHNQEETAVYLQHKTYTNLLTGEILSGNVKIAPRDVWVLTE